MKNFLLIFSILVSATSFSQKISDYKYISIPQEFADEKANKYGLDELLASKLMAKNFVINQDLLSIDPCEALNVQILNTSNMFTNKVKVEFKNCHNTVVASYDGKSYIKEFEPGMRNALENAIKLVETSNPIAKVSQSPKTEDKIVVKEAPKKVETIEKVVVTEKAAQIIETKTTTTIQNKAEVYTNGILNLNRINISANQFILANPNTSVPYAIFNASAKKDVFRVQLENGTQTLGYIEDGKIVLEIPNNDGSFRREVFSLK